MRYASAKGFGTTIVCDLIPIEWCSHPEGIESMHVWAGCVLTSVTFRNSMTTGARVLLVQSRITVSTFVFQMRHQMFEGCTWPGLRIVARGDKKGSEPFHQRDYEGGGNRHASRLC